VRVGESLIPEASRGIPNVLRLKRRAAAKKRALATCQLRAGQWTQNRGEDAGLGTGHHNRL
jgi:hypothetical protein